MNQDQFRPKASDKKIRTSEDFELCYLRHQYFRRVKYNPTEAEMQPYMKIVERLTKNTFLIYFNLFKSVGMYHDDILNIGRVHLVSFLGLYSLEKMEEKKKDFEDKFVRYNYRNVCPSDIDQKNKANFTMFFKQRMEDLVRVCRQKVRNIRGQPSEEYVVFSGKTKLPKHIRTLLTDHEELGYKKIDFAIFKSIRKRANVNYDATVFIFDNTYYVAIPLDRKDLELDDLVGSEYNPYQNEHYSQPDTILEEKEMGRLEKLFYKKSNYRKAATLRNFVAKNRGKCKYKEEVATAKRILKSLGA